jgi:hypothetical protein
VIPFMSSVIILAITWPVLKMAIKSIRFLNTDGDLNLRINRDWR